MHRYMYISHMLHRMRVTCAYLRALNMYSLYTCVYDYYVHINSTPMLAVHYVSAMPTGLRTQ